MEFERQKLKLLPLSERKSKSFIENIAIIPDSQPVKFKGNYRLLEKIAEGIINARENNKAVIIAHGAHLIKNGLSLILRRMIEENYVTHIATNGAGSIHDWEFAFQGKTEEDVRENIKEGKFGLWDETGKYINLALIEGARNGRGYGESIGRMISFEELNGERLEHPFKKDSIQESAFVNKVLLTVHPCLGQDIIYTHPLCDFAAIGETAQIDFLKFVSSIFNLEGGVYISIGSAIMSPMIFEKALSMARNVARQEDKKIDDFMIVVNDIQQGNWQFGAENEPDKNNPVYYLRFCKTFDRMGAREMHYIREDNKSFLHNLYHCLKNKDGKNAK